MIHGGVEAGPNAVLAFKREGYQKPSISPRPLEIAAHRGFGAWRPNIGAHEPGRVSAFFQQTGLCRRLAKVVARTPNERCASRRIQVGAQALEPNGLLVDDFRIIDTERMIHVLNAPSPAATASISIGQTIAKVEQRFSIGRQGNK